MGGNKTLEDFCQGLKDLESALNEMGPTSEHTEGKNDPCSYEDNPNRSSDLSLLFYYFRAKADLDDDQLRQVQSKMGLRNGYEFLEHTAGCKRCQRTLKLGLEKRPRLEPERLAGLYLRLSSKKPLLTYLTNQIVN
jgi:hypothetical protein